MTKRSFIKDLRENEGIFFAIGTYSVDVIVRELISQDPVVGFEFRKDGRAISGLNYRLVEGLYLLSKENNRSSVDKGVYVTVLDLNQALSQGKIPVRFSIDAKYGATLEHYRL